jgi:hypothetical protein
MKTLRSLLPWQIFALVIGILVASSPGSLGQGGPTNTLFPVVTVRATDPFASESGDTGTFTLFRDGPTNQTLNVFCVYGGTASNGVDYATLPNFVTIPAGVRTVPVVVKPIDDTLVEGTETVELSLVPSPLLPPVNYMIGIPSNAVVYIADNDGTSGPPVVRITIPSEGATFFAPANIPICADARAPTGFVATVEFFADGNSIGIKTNNPISVGPMNPFCILWSNVPPGDYTLTAKATDDDGQSAVSDPVHISVLQSSNLPPIVRIISPANGAVFRGPLDLPIFAFARDLDDQVASVEIFADTNSLGLATVLPCSNIVGCATCPTICPSNYYRLVWSNAPLGEHVLIAQATDSGGAVGMSDPIKIAILPLPPPPTNRPPIMNIVATDPIAIEGTNCWPWLGLTNPVPTWSNWASAGACFRFFTNCGPKNATFTVHRFGATNDDVTVDYAIGGTASNGVDYVTLPGSVTVPAGERSAQITVVPIDDGPPDITSTVILKLKPNTNYIIGFPAQAAAIILDSKTPNTPQLATSMLPGLSFHLSAPGPDGAWFHIETSSDLLNWVPQCTNQVVNGSIDYIDPDTQGSQSRFYRAIPEAGPPPE